MLLTHRLAIETEAEDVRDEYDEQGAGISNRQEN